MFRSFINEIKKYMYIASMVNSVIRCLLRHLSVKQHSFWSLYSYHGRFFARSTREKFENTRHMKVIS